MKIRKHVKAFTYEPKIEGVRNGTINQTIRKVGKKPIFEGDIITFHGWEGKPYNSGWSWRIKTLVTFLFEMTYYERYFKLSNEEFIFGPFQVLVDVDWESSIAYRIARKDGIDPPTGPELKRVLKSMGAKDGDKFNIIIFRIISDEEEQQILKGITESEN